MIAGIRVGLKEKLLVRPGNLGTPAKAPSIWCRVHLFCVIGLVLAGLAFSSAPELASTNFDAAVTYAAADRETTSVVTRQVSDSDQSFSEGETLANKPTRKVSAGDSTENPGIGVELVCGLALFLWVQRFRNSWV
jgi:hypothetical protein